MDKLLKLYRSMAHSSIGYTSFFLFLSVKHDNRFLLRTTDGRPYKAIKNEAFVFFTTSRRGAAMFAKQT